MLPRRADWFGWSEIEVGLLVGSVGLSGLAMAPFVGRLSNRLGLRKLFVAGLVLLAVGTGLCAVGTAYGWVLTGRMLQGMSVAVTSAVGMSYIAKIYSAEQRGGAMGIMASGFAAGSIAGPAAGGAPFEKVGYSTPFVLILLGSVVLAPASAKALPEGHASRSERGSFGTLLARPQVRLLTLSAALSMGVLGMLEAVLAGVVADRMGTRFTLLAGLTLLGVTMIAVSVGGSVSVVAISLCAVGFASAFALVPILPRMAELGGASDQTSDSTAYALLNCALDAGMVTGPLLSSMLISVSDFTTSVLAASALLLVGAWLSYTKFG